MAKIVRDDPQRSYDLETAQAFDEATQLDKDHSGNKRLADRAQRVVFDCIAEAEEYHRQFRSKWLKLDRLWRQESLSPKADDFDVHLGGPFSRGEEYAIKMKESIFGGAHGYVSGSAEEYDADEERSELVTKLVIEQLENEIGLRRDALAHFREVAIFGVRFAKIVPEKRVMRKIVRDVEEITEAREMGKGTYYRFREPREVKQVV